MNKHQIKHLRTLAHNLKPVVMLGQNGLSEAVIEEIKTTLNDHELIKVQIGGKDKAERSQIVDRVCTQTLCEHIYSVGKQAVFFKVSKKKLIALPK